MPALAVVDSSALIAAADRSDPDHNGVVATLGQLGSRLVILTLIVAETTYFVGTRFGAAAETTFVASLPTLNVQFPTSADWTRIADLVRRYGNLPLGTANASIIALAVRLKSDRIITLDRRHFQAVRPNHVESFTLLP